MGNGRPKKLSLSPIQREILWTLKEAGEEYLTTILNTLRSGFSNGTKEKLLKDAETAIRGLMRLELVSLARDTAKPGANSVPLSAVEIEQVFPIDTFLYWDDEQGYWKWDEIKGGPNRLSLVLTEKGQEAAET